VRFNPKAEGGNLTAIVRIKTNSRENDDFSFIVKGTGYYERKPQITVKQGNNVINPNGEYDFGSVLVNKTQDVTFTIGNSGEANLNIVAVSGNYVNVNNTAGSCFSVFQQPSTVIIPESTTTFTVYFNPKVVDANYTATIEIKTDSRDNSDFSFRVKGNGRNYIIGDTGPGGGIVFFAQGGQYKECSGDLGSYAWSAAVTAAKNYRGGGFSNWYLPDRNELDLIYKNLHKNGLGDFRNSGYWSSSQGSSSLGSYALYRDFYNGLEYNNYYNSDGFHTWVRAVRAF
jgi:hypothetical protein